MILQTNDGKPVYVCHVVRTEEEQRHIAVDLATETLLLPFMPDTDITSLQAMVLDAISGTLGKEPHRDFEVVLLFTKWPGEAEFDNSL